MRFFLLYSLSVLRKEPLKIFLALCGIILGIGVYGAVRLANERVITDFDSTAQKLAGKGNYSVRAVFGSVDEQLYRQLHSIAGIESLSPRSEKIVEIFSGQRSLGSVHIIGLDLMSSGAQGYWAATEGEDDIAASLAPLRYEVVFASPYLLERRQGGEARVEFDGKAKILPRFRALPARGIAEAFGGRIIVVDISLFQELFDSFGYVDEFDLTLSKLSQKEEVLRNIREILPNGVELVPVRERKLEFERMTEAFRLNLSFLAGISLLVAILLIYNTTSYLALKRRKDFGTLLSIGLSPDKLFRFLLAEALILGVVGAVLGMGVAYLLAEYTTSAVGKTVSALYASTVTASSTFPLLLFVELGALGVVVAVLGAALPAGEVFSARVRETFHYQNVEQRFSRFVKWLALLGLLCFVLAAIFARQELLHISLWIGFVSPLFLCAAVLLLTPAYISLSAKFFSPLVECLIGIEGVLALDHLRMTLRRSVVVVASISLSLGMFLGVSIMISSFRGTVAQWLEHVITADIFVSLPSNYANRNTATIPKEFVEAIRDNETVLHTNSTVALRINYDGRPILVRAEDFEVLAETGSIFLREDLSAQQRRQLLSTNAILISEAFQSKFNLEVGDSLSIPLQHGALQGEVSGVFLDYVSEHGVVLIDRERFGALTGITEPQGLGVYLKEGTDKGSLLKLFSSLDPDRQYIIRDSDNLRSEVFRIFDATFQITYALQAISLIISLFVLLNALLMMLLEREREFMSFRALGASFHSLIKMVSSESVFLGIWSSLWGIMLGVLLSLLLVFVINQHFFGWSVAFDLNYTIVLSTFLLVTIAAFVLSLIIAYTSLRNIDARVLRYE